jgi:hypothetical protein
VKTWNLAIPTHHYFHVSSAFSFLLFLCQSRYRVRGQRLNPAGNATISPVKMIYCVQILVRSTCVEAILDCEQEEGRHEVCKPTGGQAVLLCHSKNCFIRIKTTVFWNVAPWLADVSEVLTASIYNCLQSLLPLPLPLLLLLILLLELADGGSQTQVSMYQATWRSIPQASHLYNLNLTKP